MSPELKARVRALGINIRAFAALVGLGEDTVASWGKKHRHGRPASPEPIWAWHLVRAWERYPDLLREAVVEAQSAMMR